MTAYASQDDVLAFQELYRRHAPRVRAYAAQAMRSPEERDELFQATFLKLHRSRDRYDARYPFAAFLFVIARSERNDLLRKRSWTWEREAGGETFERAVETAVAPAPEANLKDRVSDELIRAQGHLSPEQAAVLRWRAIDEEEFEEIALRLGKSKLTVRKILSRGIARLKQFAQQPRKESE